MNDFLLKIYSNTVDNVFLRRAFLGMRMLGFDLQSPVLLKAGRLLYSGQFNSAAQALEAVKNKKPRTLYALLYSYFAAYRFEDVVATYRRMSPKQQSNFRCRHYYLMAVASLRRQDDVIRTIQDVLSELPSVTASKFLVRVYPFSALLDPDLHQVMVARILSHGALLAMDLFDATLQCAHIFRERGLQVEAAQLENALKAANMSASRQMKLDLLEAQIHFRDGRYGDQLAAVNRVLTRQGLEPVALIDESRPLSAGNLRVPTAPAPRKQGPLVSILVPAYNSASTLAYALESLRLQTYENIEVIVVDDASTDETARIAAEFAAADPRFSVVPLSENSGAFVARNRGLAVAAGEFVTNQDADDWAHPRKIAMAVEELEKDRTIIGTWVEHIRCSPHRGFRALGGYIRPDASSLMFRREPVMSRMGWYDSVRAAGDGEFHLRMERTFGRQSIRRIPKLLSFVSWAEGSLSGGGAFEINSDHGIFSPARNRYRQSFGVWHETADRLYIPFPLENRPFAAPEVPSPSRP